MLRRLERECLRWVQRRLADVAESGCDAISSAGIWICSKLTILHVISPCWKDQGTEQVHRVHPPRYSSALRRSLLSHAKWGRSVKHGIKFNVSVRGGANSFLMSAGLGKQKEIEARVTIEII